MPHRKRKYSEAGRHAAWWSFVHLLVHHVADYFMIIAIVCYQLKIMWKRQHSCFLLQTFCVSPYKSGLHVPLVDPFLFDLGPELQSWIQSRTGVPWVLQPTAVLVRLETKSRCIGCNVYGLHKGWWSTNGKMLSNILPSAVVPHQDQQYRCHVAVEGNVTPKAWHARGS